MEYLIGTTIVNPPLCSAWCTTDHSRSSPISLLLICQNYRPWKKWFHSVPVRLVTSTRKLDTIGLMFLAKIPRRISVTAKVGWPPINPTDNSRCKLELLPKWFIFGVHPFPVAISCTSTSCLPPLICTSVHNWWHCRHTHRARKRESLLAMCHGFLLDKVQIGMAWWGLVR